MKVSATRPPAARAGCLLCPVLLLALFSCQALYRYRDVPVLARDAETKQPIPGAEVRIYYPLTPASRAPWAASGETGQDGVARLRAAPCGDAGPRVEVTAAGYLFEGKDLPDEFVQAAASAGPGPFVFELYAAPRASVELVLPTGYRGRVKAEVLARENAPRAPGQRCFRYDVPPSGVVQVVGPELLRRVLPPDFRARYADGPLLTAEAHDAEIGFWPLACEGGYQVFLAGTRAEFEDARRDYRQGGSSPGGRPQGGKGGGGRGRRNRGGDPSGSP
ncbi:MAG TPA: hypothetical protein VFE78_14245 [Gemmataceae bacterium]|jgi:hypothetical protein|nr:hypothetical protein [Gemmataceae bacterium]